MGPIEKSPLTIILTFLILGSHVAYSLSTIPSKVTIDLSSAAPVSTRKPLGRRTLFTNVIAPSAFALVHTPSPVIAADEYTTTERGIQYLVTKSPNDANSPKPQRAQKVETTYTLYLNGFPDSSSSSAKIDSSKGLLGEKPFKFLAGVSQVIKGWDLTVLDMRVGEGRRIIVPSDLGYGEKGAGGKIPGGAKLYFELELVGMGDVPVNDPKQVKWLEDNPL